MVLLDYMWKAIVGIRDFDVFDRKERALLQK